MLVAAVRAVKRSRHYRRFRSQLQEPRPSEVWSERDARIVLFGLEPVSAADRFLAFAVSGKGMTVQVPLILTVDATASEWRATTAAAEPAHLERS